MKQKLPYADSVNYWKTSKTAPDVWLAKAAREIERSNGTILAQGFGWNASEGSAAYMLSFSIDGNKFRIIWPVLPVKKRADEYAARIQAATLLYHDVKARVLAARIIGVRKAFFAYYVLPNGQTASNMLDSEIIEYPKLLEG